MKTDKEKGCVYTLPCGKCPNCAKRRVSGWSFRLQQEEKVSSSAQFLTLTYDTDHIPITKQKGLTTLVKRDIQLFMKRLRKKHSQKLTYYVVGEYGSEKNRPHYHILLFNAKQELVQDAWCTPGKNPKHLGSVYYGFVTGASIGYCLKYMSKPFTKFDRTKDDRQHPFTLMSKGLGKSYITPAISKWHKKDLGSRMFHVVEDGKKIAMTRYMKDKIYTEEEREFIADQVKQKNAINPPPIVDEQQKLQAFKQMAHLSKTSKSKL